MTLHPSLVLLVITGTASVAHRCPAAPAGTSQAELYDDPETPHPAYKAGAVSRAPDAGEDDDGLSEQTQVGGEVTRGVSPVLGNAAGNGDGPPSDIELEAEPSAEEAAGGCCCGGLGPAGAGAKGGSPRVV